jgi:hypothetical protein
MSAKEQAQANGENCGSRASTKGRSGVVRDHDVHAVKHLAMRASSNLTLDHRVADAGDGLDLWLIHARVFQSVIDHLGGH